MLILLNKFVPNSTKFNEYLFQLAPKKVHNLHHCRILMQTRTEVVHKNVSQGCNKIKKSINNTQKTRNLFITYKWFYVYFIYIYTIQGGQKKFMMCSKGKVFVKFKNIFWWSLSIYSHLLKKLELSKLFRKQSYGALKILNMDCS